MLRPPRRVLPALAAVSVLALAGCGGAGYGEPIAGSEGSATVALAPAPVTTPGVTTTEVDRSGSASASSSSGGAERGTAVPDDGAASGGDSGASDSGAGQGSAAGSGSGGSGSSGGGSTLAAYSADANRFCTGFNTATKALAVEIGAADPNDPKPLGRAIIRYGAAIDDAAEGLRGASPPSSVSSYHQRTLSWVSGVTSAIDANRSGLSSGNKSAGATVIQRVQGLGKPPAAPSSLRARATACMA